MTTYQEFFGKFTVNSANDSFSIGATAVTATNGTYFFKGYTGEGTNQFCEQITADMVAAAGAGSVTYSHSTGLVTLSITGTGETTVTWVDTALRDLLGFTGNLSGGGPWTATYSPRYVWRPSRGAASYPLGLDSLWDIGSTARIARSADGTVYGISGHLFYFGNLFYRLLPTADVITPSTGTTYQDFQQFWIDVVSQMQPVRIIKDRTAYAATTDCIEVLIGNPEDELGTIADRCARSTNSNALWDVNMEFFKYT